MMDIEKTFDKYVLNKIDFAMKVGARWEITSRKEMNNIFIPTDTGKIQETYYVIQAELGKCHIVIYDMAYKSKVQVVAGDYAGEGLSKECLEEIEKIIQQYNDKDAVKTREQRLKEIMDNNL